MATTRKYSSRSQQTTLGFAINGSATTMTVVSGAILAGGLTVGASETFTVVIDPDTALEEIVDISNWSSGNVFTIARAIDGSVGQTHSAGAIVRHMAIGRDHRESNTHAIATSAVHGVVGTIVGTTDVQVITYKDMTSVTNTFPATFITASSATVFTNKDLTSGTNTFPTSLLTLTGAQVATNKDLTSGTNTFPTSLLTLTGAQVATNKDLTSGTNTFPTSLVTLTGTQTLTNKTLTAPAIILSINTQTGTTYTAVLSDNQAFITLNNAGAITFTVPTNAVVAFPIGSSIPIKQIGAGQVTISGAGVTFYGTGTKLRVQNSGATLTKVATDTWSLDGDIV